MGRRYEAEALYEDEYQEEECTRAAISGAPYGVPSYDDQFEDRTRSARESHVALEGLARSAERARAAFVAPAELEGERSPAMRARRQSYIDAAELEGSPAMRARRQSYVDASELIATPQRPSFVTPSERRSRVERSEAAIPTPGPIPSPPTPRASRHSYVASSERADFASSAPHADADADEVTSYRERPQSQRPQSQHAVRESTYAPAIASSEIEEVVATPAPVERNRPVDYEALKHYLFDDVPADSPEAAAMSREDRSVSMQTPVATFAPRATHKAFRPAMHSIRPEIAPAARISHHAFRPSTAPASPVPSPMPQAVSPVPSPMPAMMQPQPSVAPAARVSHHAFRPPMMTGPQLMAMPQPMSAPQQRMSAPQPMSAPVQQDSYIDSSWIVPTPPFPSSTPPAREPGTFKLTLSFVAAAVTAVAALTVMIGAILFVRSEDTPSTPPAPAAQFPAAQFPEAHLAAAQDLTAPPAQPPAAQPPTAQSPATQAPAAQNPAAQLPPATTAAPATPIVAAKKPEKTASADKPETPKKKKPAVVAPSDDDEDEDDAPPPPPKKKQAKTAADKSVEAMLAELGEEQLKR